MILLIPVSPEVSKHHTPKIIPALFFLVLLAIAYIEFSDVVAIDSKYVEGVLELADQKELDSLLANRPLLKIAPARGNWDIQRTVLANFIHGNLVHLGLNLVGIFAGTTICISFIPFLLILSIFLIGGTLGLLLSLLIVQGSSAYIPHVGASAGLFALMGTYYVYNFNYRTRYFYWFPSKVGYISLKTNWFFFGDVILLELILSTSQFFPTRVDSIDHFAHVIGFFAGIFLSLGIRKIQGWPGFLQTRAEYLFWKKLVDPQKLADPHYRFTTLCELLRINPYNDQLKLRLLSLLENHLSLFRESDIKICFSYLKPTFIGLYRKEITRFLIRLLRSNSRIPEAWLLSIPYDVIIRIAQEMAQDSQNHEIVYDFVHSYRITRHRNGESDPKLELLVQKMESMNTKKEVANTAVGDKANTVDVKISPQKMTKH